MKNSQGYKSNHWKQQIIVLLVSGMLGVSNILRNENKFITDFKTSNSIIKVEEQQPKQIVHPNLLWRPEFYIKELFERLNNRFKFN